MEITWKTFDHILMVKICGDIDHHTCEMLRQQVDQALESTNSRSILFSFAQVSFMDSSGIGMLMGRKRLLGYSGGTVSAIHVSDRLKKIMELSGISRYVEISQESVWNKIRR